jgi:hypothetical protein
MNLMARRLKSPFLRHFSTNPLVGGE